MTGSLPVIFIGGIRNLTRGCAYLARAVGAGDRWLGAVFALGNPVAA